MHAEAHPGKVGAASDDKEVAGRGLKAAAAAPVVAAPVVGTPIGDHSPFASYDNPHADGSGEKGQGTRVMAVIAALVLVLGSAVILTIVAVMLYDPTHVTVANNSEATDGLPPPEMIVTDDALPELTIINRPTYVPKPAAEPAPRVFKPVTIVIGDGTHFTGVTAKCPGLSPKKASFKGTTATIGEVPVDTGCEVTFQGGSAAKWKDVRGGANLTCTFGAVPNCK